VLAAAVLGGCVKSAITESDTARMRREFSPQNEERVMRELGREQELRERREAERRYLDGAGPQGAGETGAR
jgi:hypothetical protein